MVFMRPQKTAPSPQRLPPHGGHCTTRKPGAADGLLRLLSLTPKQGV